MRKGMPWGALRLTQPLETTMLRKFLPAAVAAMLLLGFVGDDARAEWVTKTTTRVYYDRYGHRVTETTSVTVWVDHHVLVSIAVLVLRVVEVRQHFGDARLGGRRVGGNSSCKGRHHVAQPRLAQPGGEERNVFHRTEWKKSLGEKIN